MFNFKREINAEKVAKSVVGRLFFLILKKKNLLKVLCNIPSCGFILPQFF